MICFFMVLHSPLIGVVGDLCITMLAKFSGSTDSTLFVGTSSKSLATNTGDSTVEVLKLPDVF